jgi:serine/threonine-protein kinase
VLPFVNMSGKPDEEYFSDGMTEELLNVLGEGARTQGRGAHLGVRVQGQGRRRARDRAEARRREPLVEGSIRRDGGRCA